MFIIGTLQIWGTECKKKKSHCLICKESICIMVQISHQASMQNLGLLPICEVFLQAFPFPTTIKKMLSILDRAGLDVLQRLTSHLILEFCCVAIMKLLYLLPSPRCSRSSQSFGQQKKSKTTSCISSPYSFVNKSKARRNALRHINVVILPSKKRQAFKFWWAYLLVP